MARNRVVSASRFLASSEWPVCAPLRRVLVFVSAIRVGKMDSRGPVPDMMMMRVCRSFADSEIAVRSTRSGRPCRDHSYKLPTGYFLNCQTPSRVKMKRYTVNTCLHDLSNGILSIVFLRVKHLIQKRSINAQQLGRQSAYGHQNDLRRLTSHREAGKMCLLR